MPFRFDVHALILKLGRHHARDPSCISASVRRSQPDDHHREFFDVTPAEVRLALAELGTQDLVEYRDDVRAPEWRQSGGPERALLPS